MLLRQSDECVVWTLRMLSSAISHRAVKGECSSTTTITGSLSSQAERTLAVKSLRHGRTTLVQLHMHQK